MKAEKSSRPWNRAKESDSPSKYVFWNRKTYAHNERNAPFEQLTAISRQFLTLRRQISPGAQTDPLGQAVAISAVILNLLDFFYLIYIFST